MPRSRASSASEGSTPRRGISPSRSRTLSRTPSRSPSPRASRSRSRSHTRSRSRSPSGPATGGSGWNTEVKYDEFVPADEETPTFSFDEATVNLVRTKVYQAPPLGKKFFNDLKKTKYMLGRDVHETLEPKPVPAQVVASMGGMDFYKLHGSLLTLHNITRVAHRPVWALTEQLQRIRGNLERFPLPQFVSPPFLTGSGSLPAGFVELNYPEEEELRHMARAPQNPTPQQFLDIYKSLGVYTKFHEVAMKAMAFMISVMQGQQEMVGNVRTGLDEMWSRSQDFLNMARFQETHLKEMRRSQLVKAHTKEFSDWLDVYMKDRKKLGARDESDEILAADYEAVLKQFNEDRKNRNTALKNSRFNYKRSAASNSGASGSGGARKDGGQSGRDRSARSPRRDSDRPPPAAPKRQPRPPNPKKRTAPQDSQDSAPKRKKYNKDNTA